MREIASLETVFSVCVCFHSPTCTSPRLSTCKPLHNALQGRHRCILGSSSPKMIVIGLMACKQARGCFCFFPPESKWEMQPVLSPALTRWCKHRSRARWRHGFSAPTASARNVFRHSRVFWWSTFCQCLEISTQFLLLFVCRCTSCPYWTWADLRCTDSWTDLK